MGDLFFEIVSMMGIRGYNILPFKFLIDNRMKNNRHREKNEVDKIVEIPDATLLDIIVKYRTANYKIDQNHFGNEKMGFSMIFDHATNGMRTLVLISNEKDGLTSKDTIVDFIGSILKLVTGTRTKGQSTDPFLKSNKVSGIFILNSGVSSFSKTFLNELSTLEIITESEIRSRCYDSCLQSHIATINSEEKDYMLAELGLDSGKIPSITKNIDTTCRIMGLTQGDLMIATRGSVSEEETLSKSIFFRNIN